MAANDHDNAPHGDNIISQGETVENRPLASEPVPDPEDIERQSERQAKIAALPNRSIDPKKAVVLAAVACGAIVLGFSTIDAMRSDPTEKAEKAEKPDERQLANYDPKSIIAPTLADAPNDPNAPVPMTEVPALDGSQAPRTAGASGRPQKSEGKSSQRRSAAPELWPMVAKTAVGSAERWQLPPACPWAAAQEDRARSCLARRPMAMDRADRAGPISKTCARPRKLIGCQAATLATAIC
ncbi:hypothetical protein [Novosphingobium sp. G106]|uniref:hypothetical protein n=1 Tax=Novosphingobium sp. G106 TaxID=2849500 RepID=UPI0020C4185C|nr:hypothetical protein [Novosphingobium sp. G106]